MLKHVNSVCLHFEVVKVKYVIYIREGEKKGRKRWKGKGSYSKLLPRCPEFIVTPVTECLVVGDWG